MPLCIVMPPCDCSPRLHSHQDDEDEEGAEGSEASVQDLVMELLGSGTRSHTFVIKGREELYAQCGVVHQALMILRTLVGWGVGGAGDPALCSNTT